MEEQFRAAFGDRLRTVSDRELTQACGSLFDAISSQSLTHVGDPAIRAALDGAAKSDRGDPWRWVRKASTFDISPLMAATVALHVHSLPADPVFEPMFAFSR